MKRIFFKAVLICTGLFTATHSFAQQTPAVKPTNSIAIVSKLEKPKTKYNEKDLGGYLLVYFKDQNQSAYFAISKDGYTFTDVNGGQPLFIGSELAEQKG